MKKAKMTMVVIMAGLLFFLAACNGGGRGAGSAAGRPVTIKVEIFDRGSDGGKSDPTNNEWTKWIKEKILKDENIIVDFIRVPRGDETNALVNLMAAGTPPDVCVTYSQDNITNWANQGGVFDMAPHVDTLLKDLKEFLGPDKALPGRDMIMRQQDAATGKLYSIPARRMNIAQRNVFIRTDWLDKLSLPLPKTTQEFYDTLVAFKEKDPGNVGKNKVVPFSLIGDRVDWTAGNIMDSFVDPGLSTKERWINTVAERNFLLPGYKEGIRFLNKMYNAGLIDRDFPLYKDGETFGNQIKAGVVGSFSGDWDQIYREPNGLLSDLKKNIPSANLAAVDCITSSDGLTHKSAYDAAGVFFFIPASSKNPEAAMRYVNWLARYENYHFIQTGPEGIVHTIVDGVPKLNPSAAGGWIQNSSQNIDYTIPMNGLFLGSDELNIKALANGYSWSAELVSDAYIKATTNARPAPVVRPSSPLTVAGPLAQTLVDKGKVIYTESILCPPAQFDRVVDAAIRDWLASGAQVVIDERREKYVEP
jgi:putative aldouronate transport system substrate-binding protein